MAGMSIQVTGLDAALRDLRATRQQLLPTLGRALHEEAKPVMQVSQDRYVPVDKGDLKASGTVHEPEIRGDSVSVELTYGGPGIEYAEVVHEDLTMRHPNGGSAKFLELPFLERANGMGERVGARAAREIGRG